MYEITKGRLRTMWVLGLLAFVSSLFVSSNIGAIACYFFVSIPFALVVYTIGWRRYHREKDIFEQMRKQAEGD